MTNETRHQLAPLLSAFLNEHLIHDRGLSQLTRASYAQTFILLLQFMKKPFDSLMLEDITPELVSTFLKDLESQRGNSRSTRNLRLAAVRSFFRYAGFRVPAALDQCSRIRSMKAKKDIIPVVDWMTVEETTAVLRAPTSSSPDGVVDRALLLLTYACGLRSSEALALSLSDLALGPKPAVHIMGKGRRARVLPLAPNTVRIMRAWLAIRPAGGSDHVFLNRHGFPLTRDAFAIRLRKYVRAAATAVPSLANKTITPHVLRHSCAMHMLKETKDIRKVSLWLGHASLVTTEIYLHADPEEKLEILTSRVNLGIKAGRFSKRASDTMTMLRAACDRNGGLRLVPALKAR